MKDNTIKGFWFNTDDLIKMNVRNHLFNVVIDKDFYDYSYESGHINAQLNEYNYLTKDEQIEVNIMIKKILKR